MATTNGRGRGVAGNARRPHGARLARVQFPRKKTRTVPARLTITCSIVSDRRARMGDIPSWRELASGDPTTRAQNAALQVGSIGPALPQHACRRPQYLQPSTPSRLALDAADLSSRGREPMAKRNYRRMTADAAISVFRPMQLNLTMPVAMAVCRRCGYINGHVVVDRECHRVRCLAASSRPSDFANARP